MHQRGLLQIKSAHCEQVDVAVLPQPVKHVFITVGFDSMNHNPPSTTVNAALHGTFNNTSLQPHNVLVIFILHPQSCLDAVEGCNSA